MREGSPWGSVGTGRSPAQGWAEESGMLGGVEFRAALALAVAWSRASPQLSLCPLMSQNRWPLGALCPVPRARAPISS